MNQILCVQKKTQSLQKRTHIYIGHISCFEFVVVIIIINNVTHTINQYTELM